MTLYLSGAGWNYSLSDANFDGVITDPGHRIVMDGGDGLSEVAHQTNDMLDALKELNERNTELLQRSNRIESEQLTAQMNPHFLYNTLEIIRKGLVYGIPWGEMDCVVVGEAANGVEGAARIEELRPDIVPVDINMPVKDGLEMLQETIDRHHFSAVILSGYSSFDYARTAVHLGVTEYLNRFRIQKEEAPPGEWRGLLLSCFPFSNSSVAVASAWICSRQPERTKS